MKYKIGELVNWIEEYADGDLVRDAGIGILLSVKDYTHKESNYRTYTVYRNKHTDTIAVSDKNISKLKLKRRIKNEFI